jgi:hypothetical protein
MRSYLATFGLQKLGPDDIYEVEDSCRGPDFEFLAHSSVMASLPALLSALGSGEA